MFGTKKDDNGMSTSPKGADMAFNTIAKGTIIEGNISAEGDLRIEGKINGTVICNSKLVVGKTGYIEGSVDARNATVEGEISGNVITRELLQVDPTGKITGDIITQKLVVQMGAVFTGNCRMGDAAKDSIAKPVPRLQEPGKNSGNGAAESKVAAKA